MAPNISLQSKEKPATSTNRKNHSSHSDNSKTESNTMEIPDKKQTDKPKKTLKILENLSSKMRAVINDKSNETEKTPAIVNGFTVSPLAMPAKPTGFKIQSVPSAGQTKKRKRSASERVVEPKTQLNKPQWTSAGQFVVTKIPKYEHSAFKPKIVSTVTDFIVTSLDKKSAYHQKATRLPVETVQQPAYNFKEKVLYGDRNKRESSKEMLQKKEKQKKFTYF